MPWISVDLVQKGGDPSSAKRSCTVAKSLRCNNAHNWTSSFSPQLTLFLQLCTALKTLKKSVASVYPPKRDTRLELISMTRWRNCFEAEWKSGPEIRIDGDQEKPLWVKIQALRLHVCIKMQTSDRISAFRPRGFCGNVPFVFSVKLCTTVRQNFLKYHILLAGVLGSVHLRIRFWDVEIEKGCF